MKEMRQQKVLNMELRGQRGIERVKGEAMFVFLRFFAFFSIIKIFVDLETLLK